MNHLDVFHVRTYKVKIVVIFLFIKVEESVKRSQRNKKTLFDTSFKVR